MIYGIPYDAEVEHLESTGTQWINTGVPYSDPCTIRVVAELTPSSAERDLFGAYTVANTNGNMVCGIYNYFVFLFNYPLNRLDSERLGSDPVMLDIVCECGNNKRTLTVNGQSYYGDVVYFNGADITIYRGNAGNSSYRGIFKCYRFSIARAGVLVRDFIPVRFTNENGVSEGAMYDRVTKKIFRNQGTGAFVIGPDI